VEPHEYQTLFENEASYWWFRSLHSVLLDTVNDLGLGPDDSILDAGCGTGQNLVNMTRQVTNRAYGFDLAAEAAPFWSRRGLQTVCRASVNDIPFADDTFNAVISVDVLECDAVDETRAYHEMWRVLKKGGHLILLVPAYDWLMTKDHHRAVGASRRYSRSRLQAVLRTRPVTLIRMTHLFGALLPAIAAYRLTLSYFPRHKAGPPTSEIQPLPPVVNETLFRIMGFERRFLRRWDLPFGSSILAVVRKAG